MKLLFVTIILIFYSSNVASNGLHVLGIGVYDIEIDGSDEDQSIDFRYENRFDNTIFDIGPEEDNFFFLKPFIGFEYTGDKASYFMTGIYLEDNIGQLITGEESNYIFTPSFAFGYYDEGSGKKLGNDIEFRTGIEISYLLKNKNRIGFSISHISNANLGDKNPGVEIISLSYQIPF